MKARDRIVVIAIAVLVLLGAGWVLVVSPERKEASKLATQVNEAQTQLSSAESQLTNARSAQAQYASAYASIVNLGKAVPPSQEVPSLIYQLAQASNNKHVEFDSISSQAGGTGSATSGAPTASTVVAASFTQMPFTFTFEGSFFDLEHLFEQLNKFAERTTAGGVQVSGRLLTVREVKLTPVNGSSSGQPGARSGQLTGEVTASAYVLPASQGLTGGATAGSPAGAATPASASASGSSSPTAPAVVKVGP